MSYTAAAGLGVAAALVLDLVLLRTNLVRTKAFWLSYALLLCFELVIDGILTGRHLVVYSPSAIVGRPPPRLVGDWHLGYAPFEDILFGFSLILQTLCWWTWWGRRGVQP
jgi:lycopene cyclase domain-containing protein